MNIPKGNVDQTVTHTLNPVLIAGIIQSVTQGVTACGAFLLIVKIEGFFFFFFLPVYILQGWPDS